MTCEHAQTLLPLDLYGDLSEAESASLRAHLAQCPACRADRVSLEQARNALAEAPPVAPADVALATVHRVAVAAERSARRWRRLAVTATALAAAVTAILVVRPVIQVDDHGLVVRWSERPTPPAPPASRDAEMLERLEILSQLVRALADEAEGRDRDRKRDIEVLQARLQLLGVQTAAHLEETQRDMGALYRLQSVKKEN